VNIVAFNPDVESLEETFLAQSYTLGVTSIEVKNNQKFNLNDRILIGAPGLATSEIVTASTPNAHGTTLPIGATMFSHESDTPVYQLQFDQVRFYRSITGINGAYTVLATIGIDVTSNDFQTTYNDATAIVGYFYKVSVYNSISTVESSLSDPIPAVSGWARNQVGYLIDQVYQELTDVSEDNMPRSEIIGYMNEVNDDLQMQVVRPYNFLYTRQAFSRVASSNTLAWPVDASGNNSMWKFDRMDYNFVDSTTTPVTNNTYTVEVVGLAYFRNRHITNENDTTTQSDQVQELALDESQKTFNYYPFSATSAPTVWYLYYWTTFNTIISEGNTIQTPTPKIYKHYIAYKYYLKRSVTDPSYLSIANIQFRDYTTEKIRYKGQDRRDIGSPRRFESEGRVRKSFRR
jgi:hypothetical protein